MSLRAMTIGAAALALAGCAVRDGGPVAGHPIPIEGDSITYQTSRCFGACPVYSVTVRPDGTGSFDGQRYTAVSGIRSFKLTRAQYDSFAARLEPYRPESGERRIVPGEPACGPTATDMSGVTVQWTRAIGDSQSLHVYYGCNMEANRAMFQALKSAPEALPIAELIGGK